MANFTITGVLIYENSIKIDWIQFIESNNLIDAQNKVIEIVRGQHKGESVKSISVNCNEFELIAFNPKNSKWEFRVLHKGHIEQIILNEMAFWPVLLNQKISLVESWLLKNYLDLIQLAFGYTPTAKRIQINF